jgi:isoamylase
MLLGGDEFGRSQGGNNNAWCQDSEISWFNWADVDDELREFTRRIVELRLVEPVFRCRDFLIGDEVVGSGLPDVVWFGCDGRSMADEDWEREDARALGVFLNGEEIPNHDRDGNPIHGRPFLLLFNAHYEPLSFAIPADLGDTWTTVIGSDTTAEYPETAAPGDELTLEGRSAAHPAPRVIRGSSPSSAARGQSGRFSYSSYCLPVAPAVSLIPAASTVTWSPAWMGWRRVLL